MTFPELPYFIAYSLKKSYSLARAERLPCRTISIGNITVGGTGKTPATIAVAGELKKRGFSPIILTRGYRGKAKGPCFVRPATGKGAGPSVSTVEEAGDEPLLMVERLGDVPVVKCADRYAGGMFALEHLSKRSDRPFVFVLDDGFQHWKLRRDTDIVLVDGLDPFGNGKLLPMGRLREPLDALRRADFLIVTRVANEGLLRELKGLNPNTPIFSSVLSADRLRHTNGETAAVEALKGKRVLGFCGIGNPEAFRQTLLPLCGELVAFTAFRDHYRYRQKDLTELAPVAERLGCDFLVTTEKDMIKLKGLEAPKNLVSLEISLTLAPEVFDAVLGR